MIATRRATLFGKTLVDQDFIQIGKPSIPPIRIRESIVCISWIIPRRITASGTTIHVLKYSDTSVNYSKQVLTLVPRVPFWIKGHLLITDVVTEGMDTLHWRHNERDGVSNHQPHDYLLHRLFGRRSKKTSKLRATGRCEGDPPVTGGFPAQRASNAENVWWRHHEVITSIILCYMK